MVKKLIFCLFLISSLNCLHFMLREGKEKCIYDEIPKN